MQRLRESNNIGDVKTLSKNVSNVSVMLEKGDKVEIIGVSERGYDLQHVSSKETVLEAGFDIFEKEDKVDSETKRRIRLWTKLTVSELQDILENEPLSDEQDKAMKTVIELLESRL